MASKPKPCCRVQRELGAIRKATKDARERMATAEAEAEAAATGCGGADGSGLKDGMAPAGGEMQVQGIEVVAHTGALLLHSPLFGSTV